jgi:hypothetical protein
MMDGLRTAATRLALRAARALSPEMRATYTGGVRPTDPRILEIFGGAATSAGVVRHRRKRHAADHGRKLRRRAVRCGVASAVQGGADRRAQHV